MSDRQSQLAVLTDGLPEAAQTVRLNASLKGAVEWVSRHATSWELRGFGAIVGGLVVFSPLIDGGTTQLPVLMMRLVLMTSVATIAGHFPLTLVDGPGAAARNAIGLVLVGGMAIGSVFTLFVLPSVYVLLAKDHSKDRVRQMDIAPAVEPEPSFAK